MPNTKPPSREHLEAEWMSQKTYLAFTNWLINTKIPELWAQLNAAKAEASVEVPPKHWERTASNGAIGCKNNAAEA